MTNTKTSQMCYKRFHFHYLEHLCSMMRGVKIVHPLWNRVWGKNTRLKTDKFGLHPLRVYTLFLNRHTAQLLHPSKETPTLMTIVTVHWIRGMGHLIRQYIFHPSQENTTIMNNWRIVDAIWPFPFLCLEKYYVGKRPNDVRSKGIAPNCPFVWLIAGAGTSSNITIHVV